MTRTSETPIKLTILAVLSLATAAGQDAGNGATIYSGGDLKPKRRLALGGAALTDAMIQNAVAIEAPVMLTVPRFKRMGDSLALAINRLNPDPNALNERKRIAMVDILEMSFANPRAISKSSDRMPNATLALLERLNAPGTSVLLHERIAAAKLAIQTSVATLH